ncbi:MAG: hypothetical protein JXR97_10045 [Planctomycetes bacterium]|nr:hypothetical protein [Planctomycetota bacterium]
MESNMDSSHVLPVNINPEDFGILPDTGYNLILPVRKMIAACKGKSAEINFQPGQYNFHHQPEEEVSIAFNLQECSDLTINGNGAELICHGYVMPFRIERSNNIEIKGFSIDWERPYITQGRIAECTADHVDIEIDRIQYPYVIQNGRFFGTGQDWGNPRPLSDCYHDAYDAETQEIPSQIRDNPFNLGPDCEVCEISDKIVSFKTSPRWMAPKGTYVALNHGRYIVKGIDIVESRNVSIRNMTLYHVLSGGVVASRTENLNIDGLRIIPNASKGRVFSGVADGIHFIHCKGDIIVENVEMAGHGDDFLNIHGRNSVMIEKIDSHTVKVIRADCWGINDEVWVVRQDDVQRKEILKVVAIERMPATHPLAKSETQLNNGINLGWGLSTNKEGEWIVSFAGPIPDDVVEGDVFENKTWNPDLFILRNCRILRKHRARGVLVTVPGQVVIENNYFATAGAAILFEGDTLHWYESGGVEDVLIQNNIFDNCLSSGASTQERWQWGGGIITITPSHQPQGTEDEPYHRNIRIVNNKFDTYDQPLVRARSVRGLVFSKNTIAKSTKFKPFAFQKESFWLDGCREVTISENIYPNGYHTTVCSNHMKSCDMDIDNIADA